ncbi:hypothetical protein EMCRGX_G034475 [Ephydatia muelleri]
MSRRCGGTTDPQEATPEIQQLADQLKGDLELRIKKTFHHYVAETYATQVVAGLNYFIKVSVDNHEYIHLRVFKGLDQQILLHSYQDGKSAMDPLVYF